jgi:hypothetical protein
VSPLLDVVGLGRAGKRELFWDSQGLQVGAEPLGLLRRQVRGQGQLAEVRAELGEVRRLQRQAQLDYEAGELTAKLYSRLDAEYDQRITAAEVAQRRLEARRAAVEVRYRSPSLTISWTA